MYRKLVGTPSTHSRRPLRHCVPGSSTDRSTNSRTVSSMSRSAAGRTRTTMVTGAAKRGEVSSKYSARLPRVGRTHLSTSRLRVVKSSRPPRGVRLADRTETSHCGARDRGWVIQVRLNYLARTTNPFNRCRRRRGVDRRRWDLLRGHFTTCSSHPCRRARRTLGDMRRERTDALYPHLQRRSGEVATGSRRWRNAGAIRRT